jgi:hypothetical protein
MSTYSIDDILMDLPEDDYEAATAFLVPILHIFANEKNHKDCRETLVELHSALVYVCNSREKLKETKLQLLDFDSGRNIDDKILADANRISFFVKSKQFNEKLIEAQKRVFESFELRSGTLCYYEFSTSDIDIIQSRLNSLRNIISSSNGLEENHRSRLLKRIEQLQTELHKKNSDLDRFWGLVGDASVVLKKIAGSAEDSKKIVESIKDIIKIIFAAQLIAYGLPYSDNVLVSNDILPQSTDFQETSKTDMQ